LWVTSTTSQATTSRPPTIAGACFVVSHVLGRTARGSGSLAVADGFNQNGSISLLL